MAVRFIVLGVLWSSGCGGKETGPAATPGPSCADTTLWYRDADGDGHGSPTETVEDCQDATPAGYVASPTDCDDRNPSISPDAAESCNLLDDDCDLAVDEDVTSAPTWYPDADGDGAGVPKGSVSSCTQPGGYAWDSSDCDDHDARVNPWATEICNLIDDDCNGTIDDPDLFEVTTYWVDADGDGFGSPTTVEACTQPDGTATNDLDCDDLASSINPSAHDPCEDGIDGDCDGIDAICVTQWSGVRTAVAEADLTGWVECFTGTYRDSAPLADLLAACTGENLLLACRQAGTTTLTVAAHAPREDALFDVGTGAADFHDANGASWYYNATQSWGFFHPGDGVNRASCDTSSGSFPAERLCWNIRSDALVGGSRCGATTGLERSSAWERVIFHADF